MKLSERSTISASRDQVWNVILDVPTLASCIPGATVMATSDRNRYQGTIRSRLGPVVIEVEGNLSIQETNADQWRVVMEVEGVVRRAGGSVEGTIDFELKEPEIGRTAIDSTANLKLTKTLALLDNTLMKRKVSSLFQEFARNLNEKVKSTSG